MAAWRSDLGASAGMVLTPDMEIAETRLWPGAYELRSAQVEGRGKLELFLDGPIFAVVCVVLRGLCVNILLLGLFFDSWCCVEREM